MDDSHDNYFVDRAQKGSKESFGVLYDRYVEKIYRFVYYKTLSKDVTEDVVSAAFLKALERISTFDANKGTFSQWMYTIARNAIVDHFRKAGKETTIEDVFALGEDERTEAKLDAVETVKKVERYIKLLNPRQREIVILRIWEEMSYRDIAEIVGGTEESVKMMFSRTIRDIRENFGKVAPKVILALLTGVTSPEVMRTIQDGL